jgi:hypothetical protein
MSSRTRCSSCEVFSPTRHSPKLVLSTMHRVPISRTLRALAPSTRGLRTSVVHRAAKESKLESPPAASSTVSDILDAPESTDRGPSHVQTSTSPSDRGYAVPPGPYPTSAPYENFPSASRPEVLDRPISSTSPNRAHPTLSNKVPRNESGVLTPGGIGASSAVRHADAPGEMGAVGGGRGGAGIQDPEGTKPGEQGELPDVNDVPLFENTEKLAKKGVKEGWTERK